MKAFPGETVTLGRMMGLIARRWRQILDGQLRPHDLTDATWQPLLELQRHGRPLHPKELAEALLLDKSSMVRILRTLEEKNFITREPMSQIVALSLCVSAMQAKPVCRRSS